MSAADALWYKDAIIYELHVRAFADADGDGKGDFKGLTSRLDYLADLGVTAIWLLPFYPSPLRDDGYDIADYGGVHPDYGSLRDVRAFIRAAHERGLRVITELVCNHTSDAHPWFQRARRAPAGSVWRDFYVWSDSVERYGEARIIFKDFETSNWAWDHVAGAYYWHRFYAHQPDLNYDNPSVQAAVIKVLDRWLEMGVDGLRLDAVPYLFERDGTNCENLPETHGFLKRLRAHVDDRFRDRVLLAEANQWPEDAVAYFGRGDECHMCFHFPLMPRMFMALRMEDRFPIIDILDQTPAIPKSAQWALFLRNHDELTLEMVTDEERDYMYRVYAQDPQARINLGIRRRLAPLMGNNRRRVELMNGLLFALPGTPVLYYGDEIGMGDNVYLGDRNGVRTPMQWSGDRNAGFSEANRQRLYLPVITDPEYHYEAVNVEAQQANPHSFLWWTKRLIALRKQYRAFGRGSLEFLHPDNRKVLAFCRELGEERILVVANLSRYVQYAELDLSQYRGQVPVEMFGQGEFPAVTDRPFFVTLGPHAFYWFQMTGPASAALAGDGDAAFLPAADDLEAALRGESHAALLRALPDYLSGRRWYGGKSRRIRAVRVLDHLPLPVSELDAALVIVEVVHREGDPDAYLLPMAMLDDAAAASILEHSPQALIGRGEGNGKVLIDAAYAPWFQRALLELIGSRRRVRGSAGGTLAGSTTNSFRGVRGGRDANVDPVPARAEQSNTSIVFGDRFIMKLYRRLQVGLNPDLEIGRTLTDKGFPHAPPVCGWLEYRSKRGESMTLAILSQLVANEGDTWSYTLDELDHFFERAVTGSAQPADPGALSARTLMALSGQTPPPVAAEAIGGYLETARLLGSRTAEMHRVLASDPDDPALGSEPFSLLYQRSLYQGMRTQVAEALRLVRRHLPRMSDELRATAEVVVAAEDALHARFRALLGERIDGLRIRVHGDYHLGQVLWTGRDVVLIDFEGEPGRPLSERRHRRSPLQDVAGMIRSFHYASHGQLIDAVGTHAVRAEDRATLAPWAKAWYAWVSAAFLGAYFEGIRDLSLLPSQDEATATLLDALLLDKALYELIYELDNRPDWVAVPLGGVAELASP